MLVHMILFDLVWKFKHKCCLLILDIVRYLIREAAKKSFFFLMAVPLRGGGERPCH